MKQKIKIKAKPRIEVKKINPWTTHLSKVYIKMKVKDKSAKFSDAMKKAKLTYKKK